MAIKRWCVVCMFAVYCYCYMNFFTSTSVHASLHCPAWIFVMRPHSMQCRVYIGCLSISERTICLPVSLITSTHICRQRQNTVMNAAAAAVLQPMHWWQSRRPRCSCVQHSVERQGIRLNIDLLYMHLLLLFNLKWRNDWLKDHMGWHTGERPFLCKECGKEFSRQRDLKRHHRVVHSGEETYPCMLCNKHFGTPTRLSRHVRSHTGERPFQCEECGRKFLQSSALTYHKRTHTGQLLYACDVCHRKFARPANVRHHMKRQHPDSRNWQI